MKRPKQVKVIIEWIDDEDEQHTVVYENDDIENAEIHIGLMTGNVCEADLEP